jgi:DNA-binding CsgD family transcriptional regulator
MAQESLSDLIGDVYDAALDARLWPCILGRIAYFAGGVAGCLLRSDLVQGTGEVFYGFGDQPVYRRLYFEKYIHFDPVGPALPNLAVGGIVSNSIVTPRAEFFHTRFFEEWMEPQGWLDNVFITLDRSSTDIIAFALARSIRDGWADERVFQQLRLIAPHLRRAVLISKLIGTQKAKTAMLADTFDSISAGVIFVDETCRIVHANLSGQSIIEEGNVLRAANGRLTATCAPSDQDLREAIEAASRGDAALGINSLAMTLRSNSGVCYVAHLLPLTSNARGQAIGRSAVAAIFVHKAALAPGSSLDVVPKIFNLTQGETRVLTAVVQHGAVSLTAKALGISEATVKTHLHRLFSKTNTARQADLVKLVASFSNPLMGGSDVNGH